MWYFKTVTNKVTNERYQKDKREMNEVFYRLATDAVTKLCELDCVKSRDVQEPEHRSATVLDLLACDELYSSPHERYSSQDS